MISLKGCCIQCRPLLQRHAVFCPVNLALLLTTNKMEDWKRFRLKNGKYQRALNENGKIIQAWASLWSTLPLPIICLTPRVLSSELMVSCGMICQIDPGQFETEMKLGGWGKWCGPFLSGGELIWVPLHLCTTISIQGSPACHLWRCNTLLSLAVFSTVTFSFIFPDNA